MFGSGRSSRRVSLSAITFVVALAAAALSGRPAVSDAAAPAGAGGQACRGKCLDPHPGQFRSWYGQRNGCWVQVWRQWPEGCTHYQMFNSCQNQWDVHPNGQPRVHWTCCVH